MALPLAMIARVGWLCETSVMVSALLPAGRLSNWRSVSSIACKYSASLRPA